jgi:GNAT superfamily N-acetyltransferase
MVVCQFPAPPHRPPPVHDLCLIEAPSPDLLAEVYRLRVRAWAARNAAFPANLESWSDPFDATAGHFVVTASGRPVAAARLTIHASPADAPDGELYAAMDSADAPPPVAALSRLVVCPRYAGRGLSRWLDIERMAHARRQGCKSLIVCTGTSDDRIAQLHALGFRTLYRAPTQVSGVLAATAPPFVLARGLQRRHAVRTLQMGLRTRPQRPNDSRRSSASLSMVLEENVGEQEEVKCG